MLVRYRGNGVKKITLQNKTLKFTNEWTEISNINLFKSLSYYPDVFDTITFFNLKPLYPFAKHIEIKKNLIFVTNPSIVRKFEKMKFIRLQAKREGVFIFRITNYDKANLNNTKDIVGKVNLLVYRELGGLGDILMTTPVVESIKQKHKSHKITYACPDEFISLMENNPFVDHFLPLSKVKGYEWDIAINLTSDCINYEVKHQPDVKLNRSEIFVKKCSLELDNIPSPKIFLSYAEIEQAKEELKANKNKIKIGIVLESNAPVRNWYKIRELRDEILKRFSYNKRILCLEFCIQQPKYWVHSNYSYPVFGRNLREVAALINECDLVISPDTGLAHIASALKIPTIWLFTHIDGKVRTKNYKSNVWIIQGDSEKCPKGKPCWYEIPCSRSKDQNLLESKKNPPCSQAITFDMVFTKINEILETPNISYCVVFHNRLDITKECLRRISMVKKFTDEIILVDNGSDEYQIEELTSIADIKLIKNKANEGCIIARNQAMKAANGRFIFTLDNDQYINLDSVHKLLIIEGDIIGTEAWSMDKDGWAFNIKDKKGELAYVGAGGMLLENKIAKDLNYFNEAYAPAWFEDPDFCFLAKEKGYLVNFHSNPNIQHLAHQTVNNQNTFDSNAIWKRNHKYFVKKWLSVLDPPPIFSVIILCLDRTDLTIRCIKSIYQNKTMPIEVILLDQGSSDIDLEELRCLNYPNFTLIEGKENRFVAKGRNYAARNARGEYLLFCDDDMILPPRWDINLSARFEETGAIAISPNVVEQRKGNRWIRFHASKIIDGDFVEVGHGKEPNNQVVLQKRKTDFLPGGSMCIRKDIFDKLPLDEKYVYGLEDYDWCMQAKKYGEMYNCPNVFFIHDKGDSTRLINKYNKIEKNLTGSSYIQDSCRLFMYRYKKELPVLWDRKDYLSLALGGNQYMLKTKSEIEKIITEEVKKRYPDEII